MSCPIGRGEARISLNWVQGFRPRIGRKDIPQALWTEVRDILHEVVARRRAGDVSILTMKLLHLISSEGFYGAESVLVLLARSLAQNGYPCCVGVFRDTRAPHIEIANEARACGLAVEEIPCNGRIDLRAVQTIRDIARRHNAEVLHSHGYKSDIYAYLAGRRGNRLLMATCHGQIRTQWALRAYCALDRAILRRFDRVAAVSDQLAEALVSSGLQRSKVTMIANGVDLDRFAHVRPVLRNEFAPRSGRVIGMVGRLAEGKGADVLIEAAPRVLAHFPDTTFVLVGGGPQRGALEALAGRLNVSQNVVFAGVRRDMPEVYASLDVVVLASLNEGMPMCLLEAMAAARPVVATPVGSIPLLIRPEETGLLAAPGDPGDLAAKILQVLSRPGEARVMAENARRHVASRYSATVMAQKYIDIYEQARQDAPRRICQEWAHADAGHQ